MKKENALNYLFTTTNAVMVTAIARLITSFTPALTLHVFITFLDTSMLCSYRKRKRHLSARQMIKNGID
jgi:hypothetical protein